MPKIGLDLGSFGLVSGAPMGGEYLGTIGTIPGGLQWKCTNQEWKTPFLVQKWTKIDQNGDLRLVYQAGKPQSSLYSEEKCQKPH